MFAVTAGWELSRVCGVLEIDRQRVWRWQQRQTTGTLDDAAPGGRPVNTILGWEEEAILDLFEKWGPVDFSTVNSRTEAPTLARYGFHRQRSTGSWPTMASHWLVIQGLHGRSRNRGRTGFVGNQTSCGAGTQHISCVAIPRSCTASSMLFHVNGSQHCCAPKQPPRK